MVAEAAGTDVLGAGLAVLLMLAGCTMTPQPAPQAGRTLAPAAGSDGGGGGGSGGMGM